MRVHTILRGQGIVILGILLGGILCGCAGKRTLAEETRATETGEYLLFVSNVQGNPLCLFGSIQKMRVAPWIGSARTRWRASNWLLFPGGSHEMFFERGRRKQDPSVPLSWTRDALLLTTDNDRFVFYRPFSKDKLLLVTEPIFPDRVRRSGEDDVRYTLLPASVIWNDWSVPGRVFYQKLGRTASQPPSGFFPFHAPQAGVRSYAIWVPGGMFLFVEEQRESVEGRRAGALAIMQDRRGRWEETYHVILSEPEDLFAPAEASPVREEKIRLGLDIPSWRIQGTLEVIRDVRTGPDKPGPFGAAGSAEEEGGGGTGRGFWSSITGLPGEDGDGPVRFVLLRGTLRVDGETQSVYGVGIAEP